jgi:hypothetical protein
MSIFYNPYVNLSRTTPSHTSRMPYIGQLTKLTNTSKLHGRTEFTACRCVGICSQSAELFHSYLPPLVINPSCKKTWMTTHWPEAEVEACMDAIRASVREQSIIDECVFLTYYQMVAYREKEIKKEILTATSKPATSGSIRRSSTMPAISSSNQAHKNLQSGFQKLRGWSALVTGSTSSQQPSAGTDLPTEKTPPSAAEIRTRACEDVDRELHLYLSHPGVNEDVSACDLLAFWQVSRH